MPTKRHFAAWRNVLSFGKFQILRKNTFFIRVIEWEKTGLLFKQGGVFTREHQVSPQKSTNAICLEKWSGTRDSVRRAGGPAGCRFSFLQKKRGKHPLGSLFFFQRKGSPFFFPQTEGLKKKKRTPPSTSGEFGFQFPSNLDPGEQN